MSDEVALEDWGEDRGLVQCARRPRSFFGEMALPLDAGCRAVRGSRQGLVGFGGVGLCSAVVIKT